MPKSIRSRESKAKDQIDGDHYAGFEVDPVRWCLREKMDTCQSFAIKHVARSDLKGEAVLDLQKAIHYIAIKLEEEHGIASKINYWSNEASEDEEQAAPSNGNL